MQTALAKLYVAWPRVQRAGDQDAYCRRTVANAAVDTTRRPWRRERSGLDGVDRVEVADDVETRHTLVAALQRLPPMQRRTVVLRHWLGLSVAETARDA